jgi:hypothetical protein
MKRIKYVILTLKLLPFFLMSGARGGAVSLGTS